MRFGVWDSDKDLGSIPIPETGDLAWGCEWRLVCRYESTVLE